MAKGSREDVAFIFDLPDLDAVMDARRHLVARGNEAWGENGARPGPVVLVVFAELLLSSDTIAEFERRLTINAAPWKQHYRGWELLE